MHLKSDCLFVFLFIHFTVFSTLLAQNCYNDRSVGNAVLQIGQSLTSSNGFYTFSLREDGNLKIICDGNKIWESNTKRKDIDALCLAKGVLALYETNKTVAWTGKAWKRDAGPERIIMQNDGNFVMYDKNGNAQWDLGTFGRCPTGTHLSNNSFELKLLIKKNLFLEP